VKQARRQVGRTTIQPHVPPRHEPTLEVERMLMVDFASTQAQAKEVGPPASRDGGGGGVG
jgi:hypothetical protein